MTLDLYDWRATLSKTITAMTLDLSSNRTITNAGLAALSTTIITMTLDVYGNSVSQTIGWRHSPQR